MERYDRAEEKKLKERTGEDEEKKDKGGSGRGGSRRWEIGREGGGDGIEE